MQELKHWILNHAPDLRVTYEMIDPQTLAATASFTLQGIVHELGPAQGPDAREDILKLVADAICETLGIPSLFAGPRDAAKLSLQAEIIRASLAGDDASCARLTAMYVTRSAISTLSGRAGKGWTV